MVRESTEIRIIRGNYTVLGLNMENTYKKTDMLLKLYRKVNWSTSKHLEDLNDITYETCMGDKETLSYLMYFAPEKELDTFRQRAVHVMQTRVLIELIDKSIIKIKDYPDYGSVYYSILDLKYLNFFIYNEDDILEELDMERSTYYRKKKQATLLLGYILFGLILPEYIRNEKVIRNCD